MKILLTGATGYIGKRLLIELVSNGYDVICCVRDLHRFQIPTSIKSSVQVIEVDFLDKPSLQNIPKDIDGAYYLIHSMSSSADFEKLELKAAINFKEIINKTKVKHVVYLSDIINNESQSKYLSSRKAVEDELATGNFHFTSLRAGVIIGSGSSSFDIIRDLVERTPVLFVPKLFESECQPIGIQDVLSILFETLFKTATFDNDYDIGGPDIVSYKALLLAYANAKALKRKIIVVPLVNPRISAFWLNLVTSTSFTLATALIGSMKGTSVCRNNELLNLINISPINYQEALRRTILKVEENQVISSWKDSWVSGRIDEKRIQHLVVPTEGCFVDKREIDVDNYKQCVDNLWRIGGDQGWYFADPLWKIRGFIDKVVGGVGLNRGRKDPNDLAVGDAVDFWRILYANKEEGRLLLFAEMKVPGDAWLEFTIKNNKLHQVATFQTGGFWGPLYWYALLPIHIIIFKGMIKRIAQN